MNWYEFIFSNKLSLRWSRHLVFWLLWWAFFFGSFYTFQQLNAKQVTSFTWSTVMFVKSGLILLTHIFACYSTIYILLPHFLKGRLLLFIVELVAMSVLTLTAGYLIHVYLFPPIDHRFQSLRVVANDALVWVSLNTGLLSATKVIAAAVIIKLLKRWWLKQKEQEQLEKEKINTELQLLRAQIHPGFLFNALNSIYSLALKGSAKTPEILLKLSDLLSYMLYECAMPNVPLEEELRMMKDYMALEKIKYDGHLEMEVQIKGDTQNKKVVPFLLLPFIENSFRHCSNSKEERPWINLELTIEDDFLSMKLINGLSDEAPEEPLSDIKMRLQALYHDDHQLKATSVGEMFIVILKIPLEKVTETQSSVTQAALT